LSKEEQILAAMHDPGFTQEVSFWLRILKEHALFIEMGLPVNRSDLAAEARQIHDMFQALENRVGAGPIDHRLLQDIIRAVTTIIEFKAKLLRMILQCELAGSLYPLLIDHIKREAEHFLAMLTGGLASIGRGNPFEYALELEVFWLRIMMEHAQFVLHMLDPSERQLVNQAEMFVERFNDLLIRGMQLRSMATSNPPCFNTVCQFTMDVIAATTDLRNFKNAGFELLRACRVLSIIASPLLADHIRREADKFLQILETLKRMVCSPGRK
jgi:hypothetical protein